MIRTLAIVTGFSIAAAAPALAGTGYGAKAAKEKESKDIVDTAVAAGSFNTLAAALTKAGLVDALKGEGPFTVFAPTDDAFAKLPDGTVETLLKPENRDRLTAILTYHVVSGEVDSRAVVKLDAAPTLNGQRVDVKVSGTSVRIDGANVIQTDIGASNGIIHVIDEVLLPTEETVVGVAAEDGRFGTLIAAAKAAGLADALTGEGPFTLFAPTDDAFAKLPKGTVESLLEPENRDQLQAILKYHVVAGRVFSDEALSSGNLKTLQSARLRTAVEGKSAMVNDSKIVLTDIDAANGVIHVIDSVLMPPAEQSSSASAAELIEMAIHRGAPMYNHGNAAACAAVYEMTARALLAFCPEMPAEASAAITRALHVMKTTDDRPTQAWILRDGLDGAYRSLVMDVALAR